MNLNIFIANSGFCSRRNAGLLVKEGKAKVNGKVVYEPWYEVKESDSVVIGSKNLNLKESLYILFNKPKGVTTTLKDRFANKKIKDFIPAKLGRLYPVGRLDKDSSGLIILTNDGNLCHKLTHPKFEIEKGYIVLVKGKMNDVLLEELKNGIKNGNDELKVKSVSIEESSGEETRIKVVIGEGKKRHIRRMLGSLGFPVIELKRIKIGNLELGSLKEGGFKAINKDEIYKLALNERR